MTRSLLKDQSGAAYAEMLVALPIVLVAFLGVYMLSFLCTAHLVMQRAASAAARAAVVFLPDSAQSGSVQQREAVVREAARRVLTAATGLDQDSLTISLSGARSGWSTITANVQADFQCGPFIVGYLCGADQRVSLEGQSGMPYQGP